MSNIKYIKIGGLMSVTKRIDAAIKTLNIKENFAELFYNVSEMEVSAIPNRDKNGPEERSPKPSKKKGGDQKGDC